VFHTRIFDALADQGIPVVYGPLGSFPYKVELKHDHYRNAEHLMKSRAFFGLMTDHPVILTSSLRDTLKFFLIAGMSASDAVSLITYRNAKILGIDDDLGTIEPGKLASLSVWDRDPLHLGAFPKAVIAEGRILERSVPPVN
jgi:imidazolonepropionase-like amidohydrolase